MINLLPDDIKKELHAARMNVSLIRLLFVIILATVFLLAVFGVSYMSLMNAQATAQQVIDLNDTKSEAYASTKAELDTLNSNLAGSKTILDQEVLYSRLLSQLGQTMSNDTIIDTLSLTTSSVGIPIDLKVFATSGDAIIALQGRFQNSAAFQNVTFQSISEQGGIAGYPASATITLTINKDGLQ